MPPWTRSVPSPAAPNTVSSTSPTSAGCPGCWTLQVGCDGTSLLITLSAGVCNCLNNPTGVAYYLLVHSSLFSVQTAVNKSIVIIGIVFWTAKLSMHVFLKQFHYFKFMDFFFWLYAHIQGVLLILVHQAVALGKSLSELLVSFQVLLFEFLWYL